MSATSVQFYAAIVLTPAFFQTAIQATHSSSHSNLQFDFSPAPSQQLDCSGLAQGLWDDSYPETQQQQLGQPSLSSFSFDQFGASDSQDTSSVPTPFDQFLASTTTSVPQSEADEVALTELVSSAEIFPQDLAESQSFSEFPGQFDFFCSPSEDFLSLVREDSHEGPLLQTEEYQDLMSGTVLQQPTFNPQVERLSSSRPSPSHLSLPPFQLGNRRSANRDHVSSLTSSRADHYQASTTSDIQSNSPCYSSSNSASNREPVLEPTRPGKRSFDESTLPSTKSAENSEEDKIVEKRRRNTLAARRFRQKQQDRVTNLEAELAKVAKERDELKVLVARYQGETEALRKLVADGKKT